MEIDRKDTNIQIGKRLREARTNMNKDKTEFAQTLDVKDAAKIGVGFLELSTMDYYEYKDIKPAPDNIIPI